MAVVPVQVEISDPASATGGSYHVIILVSASSGHPLAPVKVSVAVNEPEGVEGVNVARAGSAFCVHVPNPPPPLQVGVPL